LAIIQDDNSESAIVNTGYKDIIDN